MVLRPLLAALALCLAAPVAQAHDYETMTGMKIIHPWARESLPDRPAAAYLTVRNRAFAPDKLIGAHSPVFGRIELHEHVVEDGVAKMRKVEALTANPGVDLTLEPQGLHLMLFDAAGPLRKGEMAPITLVFAQSGEIEVMLDVVGPGETPSTLAEELKEPEAEGDGQATNIFGAPGALKPID